ncbi:peptidoglycan DD-metalloendopeptidase family protein [Candidatus Nomurabacteria bacterium]|nr:peptidoglycan DD-metalloendopeptidase family protein [Candidatus Nomurabacteria bacterium]
MPYKANAGFWSSFFGTDASASDSESFSGKNSQNSSLALQANISAVSLIQEKKDKKTDDEVKEDVNVAVSGNALVPSIVGHASTLDGTDNGESSSDQISVYVVRKNDSIKAIADMFDVSVNTILLANDMKKGDKLTEGQVLVILPISGTEHTVTKGQTIQSIAKLYKVDSGDIAAYNGISEDSKLTIGDKLIIPGADDMSDEGGDKPAPNLNKSVDKDKNYYASHPIKDVVGYFINPLPTGHKTQGLHGPGHSGIDIGAPTGSPIYASASGTVLVAKTGCVVGRRSCGGGYGNMVIIKHSNGTTTLYGHMSKVITTTGDTVNQGELIGLVGSTGHSTGPHLHFEVHGAKNPGSDWSWKQ